MKVLVLSGEVTHQRPITYGFPNEWEVRVLSIVDTEHLALCEKYGDSSSISPSEVVSFLKRAYEKTIDALRACEVDAIVGVGYGSHILANLNASHEWRGPSIYVPTEGNPTKYFFVQRPLCDDLDFDHRRVSSGWIITDEDTYSKFARHGKSKSTSVRTRADNQEIEILVKMPGSTAVETLSASGVIAAVTRALFC